MGGNDGTGWLKTTEFVYTNKKSEPGPSLNFTIGGHCMVKFNENAIYVMGGKQNKQRSNQVWIFNPMVPWSDVKKGPALREIRSGFSCGTFSGVDGMKIIVAGGIGLGRFEYLDSVEILDPSTDSWIYGKLQDQ